MNIDLLLQILQEAKAQGVTHVEFENIRRDRNPMMSYSAHEHGFTTYDSYYRSTEEHEEFLRDEPYAALETYHKAICLKLDVIVH